MILHDKGHMGMNYDHTYVAVEMTSGRTPAHKRDTGEAWVTCVQVPGGSTDLSHMGSPYHILDKHMWVGGMVAVSGCVCVV